MGGRFQLQCTPTLITALLNSHTLHGHLVGEAVDSLEEFADDSISCVDLAVIAVVLALRSVVVVAVAMDRCITKRSTISMWPFR